MILINFNEIKAFSLFSKQQILDIYKRNTSTCTYEIGNYYFRVVVLALMQKNHRRNLRKNNKILWIDHEILYMNLQ